MILENFWEASELRENYVMGRVHPNFNPKPSNYSGATVQWGPYSMSPAVDTGRVTVDRRPLNDNEV